MLDLPCFSVNYKKGGQRMPINNWPKEDRPREKLLKNGEHTLNNSELLAIILRTGIRGKKVMLDKDLAVLYGVKPIALRQQVKRNRERFPEDFMFQLTEG